MSCEQRSGCGLSRRAFCAVAGGGVVTLGLGLAGCDGTPRVTVGALDDPAPGGGGGKVTGGGGGGGGGGGNPDLATGGGNPDLATGGGGNPDLATGGVSCHGMLQAGAASAIAVGAAKHFTDNVSYGLYVCRDAGGLFAVDSACTHSGCDVKLQSGHWFCPCHGATFAFDGTQPTNPAPTPLANYAVCVDASGNIVVDYSTVVGPTTRV